MEERPKATVKVVARQPGFARSLHITIPPGGETERVFHERPFIARYRRPARLERIVWENGKPRTIVEEVEAFRPYYRAAGTEQMARNLGDEPIDFDKDEIECPLPEQGQQSEPCQEEGDGKKGHETCQDTVRTSTTEAATVRIEILLRTR